MSHSLESISSSLEAAGLVPGPAEKLIPRNFSPKFALSIAFDDKAVDLGNLFRASECKTAPAVGFDAEPGAAADAVYLLLLIDPDAPTPDDPKFAFWRHWVVSGLQPLGSHATVTQTKPALTEYLGPGPKDDSKPHRYLFLLYKEPDALSLTKDDVGGEEFVERRSFDAASFTDKNSLQLVALNWMTCAGDGWKE